MLLIFIDLYVCVEKLLIELNEYRLLLELDWIELDRIELDWIGFF